MEKYNSRKWQLTCWALMVLVGLLLAGKLPGADFSMAFLAVFTSYNIANVWEKNQAPKQ